MSEPQKIVIAFEEGTPFGGVTIYPPQPPMSMVLGTFANPVVYDRITTNDDFRVTTTGDNRITD